MQGPSIDFMTSGATAAAAAAAGAAIFTEVLAYWFCIRCVCAIKVVCSSQSQTGNSSYFLQGLNSTSFGAETCQKTQKQGGAVYEIPSKAANELAAAAQPIIRIYWRA